MDIEQARIIEELGVTSNFDVDRERDRRVRFLADYLRSSGAMSYVLGISGGVDSLTAGLLAQEAVQGLRADGYRAEFVAVRLPYGVQLDERDAQASLDAIRPDRVVRINIKPAADATMMEVKLGARDLMPTNTEDFHLGNIKARQRMIVQYAIAGAVGGLVIGTDHAAEALMGFFTKHGDGAADVVPLAGLNKRRVRALAALMGAPKYLVHKVPTADLETNAPLLPDEEAFGVTYEEIDDFLEGRPIADVSRERIFTIFRKSAHKRAPAVGPTL